MTLDEALAQCPAVAIVRGVKPDEILDIAQVFYDAGLRAIEVPLNSPDPLESIRRLTRAFEGRMVCGAGTVLTVEEADAVAEAGAQIVVAPNTNEGVIRRAVALGRDPVPGFATASEAFTAIGAGARHLKLYPSTTYGPGHLKQLWDVLPRHMRVWGVGGVGPANMTEWWNAGARAFGLGSASYKAGQTVEETRRKAEAIAAAVKALPA